MSEKFKQRNKRKKMHPIFFVIVFFTLLYLILQYILIYNAEITSIYAMEGFINDSYTTPGIILRKETVLNSNSLENIDFLVEDGQRVSNTTIIATAYESKSDLIQIEALEYAQTLKDNLNYINENPIPAPSELQAAYNELYNNLVYISSTNNDGSYFNINEELLEISTNINKIYMATNQITDFSNATATLDSQINSYTNSITPPTQHLTINYSGYFFKTVDGYENIATVDNFLDFTYTQGMEIISIVNEESVPSQNYGKIVEDYRWHTACYVPYDVYQKLSQGQSIDVAISDANNEKQYLTGEIETIQEKEDYTYLVIIEFDIIENISSSMRIVDIELIFESYQGIKIPRQAMRIYEDELGVYVNYSQIANFKKIAPIYEDDEYIILPIDKDSENQVSVYDEIIINGRDLYDGKYI